MKIRKLILKNFRGYKNITIDIDSDLNVIVGKNDVGKSTVLEAMDIFLDGGTVKIDISDLNVSSTEKEMTIGLVFKIEPNREYLLDTDVKTTLESESLLNKDGFLEIHKTWDCSKNSLTTTSLSTYFHSYYFNDFQEKPLITLKNADLKKELLNRELECSNKNINSVIRKSIYESLNSPSKKEILIQVNKEDAKKTWKSIETELPMFFLFQSDRANKDSDKEVQNPLKAITKQAIRTVENKLKDVTNEVEEKIKELALLTIKKLQEMAPEVASDLTPKITNKAWESLFNFSFDDERNIPINKRGSGVRRLILLNYFRAEAERKNVRGQYVIYAIEEPETSQHPNYQIMLIKALQELGVKENSQVFITTHTPEIAKLCYEDNLILLERVKEEISIDQSNEKLLKISKTLGVLPYLCKFCVFVEGKNDIIFFKTISKNIQELNFFNCKKIPILPLIGGNLISWVNRGYVKDSNIKAFYLFDKEEEEEYKEKAQEINQRNDGNCAQLTKLRAMENYFSPSLIETHFNIKFSDEEKQKWKNENIIKLVKKNRNDLSEKDIKNKINKEVANQISKNSLEEIGVWEEVQGWFKKIKKMDEEQ